MIIYKHDGLFCALID